MSRAWLAAWLQRFAANRPTREIASGGRPYLLRVYVAHWGGWRVYLHKFVGSDGERWLHDHPFNGLSVVLAGGYLEEVGRQWSWPDMRTVSRVRRWINFIPRHRFHRIAAIEPGTWTLFIHAPHSKGWGFLFPIAALNGLVYTNPYDQSDSSGAHWWRKPGTETLAEIEGEA